MIDDNNIIGVITINEYSEIRFVISEFRGEYLINIRQFYKTPKYTGYTKKGVAFRLPVLNSIIKILDDFSHNQNVNHKQEIGKVSKNNVTDIVVRLVKWKKNNNALDIREYLRSDYYEGWTKKGIRIPFKFFNDIKVFLYATQDELIKLSKKRNIYNIENQRSKTIPKITEKSGSYLTEVKEILIEKLLKFPDDFIELSDSNNVKEVTLPNLSLRKGVFKEGIQYVVNDNDFVIELRNEVEAKYVIYAQLNGATSVNIPNNMFKIFKAVKKYEYYVREIQKKLIDYYKKIGNKTIVAKYKARLSLKKLGFPWIEEER